MATVTATTDRPAELPSRPKMIIVIEHLDSAQAHMHQATRVLSSMILDLEKGADFIGRYRDSLIKTIEETGGDVEQAVEHQIRDFIPKILRPRDDNAGPDREGN